MVLSVSVNLFHNSNESKPTNAVLGKKLGGWGAMGIRVCGGESAKFKYIDDDGDVGAERT